jgi:hypothetical protein
MRGSENMQHLKCVLERLADAARGESLDFAKLLQRLLVTDFDATLSHVKTQKLMLKQRSVAWVSQLEVDMLAWLEHASLKGKQKAQLTRHLAVSKAIQQLLDIIDKQSLSLRIWQASTRDLLCYLFASIEKRRFEQESAESRDESNGADQRNALKAAELGRRRLRTYCDYVARVVNQISAVGIREASAVSLSFADVRDAFEVALLDDLALHVLDCYTYKNFRLSIEGKHLTMHGQQSRFEDAHEWSSLRAVSSEALENYEITQILKKLEDLARGLTFESATFGDFLQTEAGKQLLEASQDARDWYFRLLRRDVADEIDLELSLETSSGTFRADDLLRSWSLLVQLAICARMWLRKCGTDAVPVLKLPQMVSLFAASLSSTNEQAERLVLQFSLDPCERNQDPFFRPLIKLDAEDLLIAATFVETSRYSRNLFTIAIREGKVNFSAKGLKPLKNLHQKFLDAGFDALLNFPVRTEGRLATDVDIAAAKDGFLFVAQTKVLIRPDTVYDEWKVLDNLRKAADQLKTSLKHVSTLRDQLGLAEGEFLVVPFLLTNLWNFTGATVDGFKVIDFSYLSMLLKGGEVWEVHFNPVPRRKIHKLIAGRHPTGEELSRLLQRPIHEAMFEKPRLEMRSFEVGEWTVSVPVDIGKIPAKMRTASPGGSQF